MVNVLIVAGQGPAIALLGQLIYVACLWEVRLAIADEGRGVLGCECVL